MRQTNDCQAYFIRLLLLSGNVEVNPGPVTCPICQQSFGRHWRLEDHQRNANVVNCNICHRCFCHRARLEQHKRTDHSGRGIDAGETSSSSSENINLNTPIFPGF